MRFCTAVQHAGPTQGRVLDRSEEYIQPPAGNMYGLRGIGDLLSHDAWNFASERGFKDSRFVCMPYTAVCCTAVVRVIIDIELRKQRPFHFWRFRRTRPSTFDDHNQQPSSVNHVKREKIVGVYLPVSYTHLTLPTICSV